MHGQRFSHRPQPTCKLDSGCRGGRLRYVVCLSFALLLILDLEIFYKLSNESRCIVFCQRAWVLYILVYVLHKVKLGSSCSHRLQMPACGM